MKYYNLDLLSVPNQKFNTTLNGANITIELRTVRDICYMSIYHNDGYIASGIKCIPNSRLIASSTVRNLINGDFAFDCLNDDYPSYEKFGTLDCKLIYISNE